MHSPDLNGAPVPLNISPTWTPTADNINALPYPLRRYIHDLKTICDPAGDVAMMFMLRTENKMLRWECERLAAKAGEGPRHNSPPLVPEGFDTDVYIVLQDYQDLGRAYRETDEEQADRETLIRDLIDGQYDRPVRIVAFNTAQRWSRDVTEEIAREIRDRASREGEELTGPVQAFVEWELERAERRRRFIVESM
jgi:hypothetical protein